MKQTISNIGCKLMYMAVSVFFAALAAWLYFQENSYIKSMDLYIMPENGQFEAEVLADGSNVQVFTIDKGVRLLVDQRQEEGNFRLLIYGECVSEREETSARVRIVSDCENLEGEWKYQILTGTDVQEAVLTGRRNTGRTLSLILAIVTAVCLTAWPFWHRNTKEQKELTAYGNRVMEILEQEPDMAQVCADGKRLFVVYEKRKVANLLLTVWADVFLLRGILYKIYHGAEIRVTVAWCGIFLGAVVLSYVAAAWNNISFGKILIEECRPVTAAAAYLCSGGYGVWHTWKQVVMYHNGAAGLYRSGHYREALDISELVWKLLRRKPNAYIVYTHSSLKYQCLKALNQKEQAHNEKMRMEVLLESHPAWKKRKDIQRVLGIQNIYEWIETGEIEQAEASACQILEQWKERYYRLPVLGLMVELKEYLGKEQEADLLRNEILTFSPENKEVRQIMSEGRLSFRWEKVRTRDGLGTGIRLLCLAGIMGSFILTANAQLREAPVSSGTPEKESGISAEPTAEEISLSAPVDPEVVWESQERSISGFSFICPENWEGLYVTERLADEYQGMIVYQKSSHESMGDGRLFSISIYQDCSYVNEPDYEVLGYDGTKVYVMSRPTDVAFDIGDLEAGIPGFGEEYHQMEEKIEDIRNSFRIHSDKARYDGQEFIFAVSDKVLFHDWDLWNLSEEALRIARNEIYARHGRKFKDKELQSYFEGCSWYTGTVEPEDFTEELLNGTEKENIRMIQREQERRGQ